LQAPAAIQSSEKDFGKTMEAHMKRSKWMAATATLAIALSTGAFAETRPQRDRRDEDNARYTQPYSGEREGVWNNDYRDNGYRDYSNYRNSYRDGDHDRDDGRRVRDRDHRDRDHGRRDRDDGGGRY
jgi:hypothetical protein